jgi:hypothetical protein
VSQPPRVGPRLGPIIAPTPKIAWPTPCRDGGKLSTRIVWAVASNAPPPSPCTMRQTTSSVTLVERPHSRDAPVKIRIDVVK